MNSMDEERHRRYMDGVANEGRILDARIANIRSRETAGTLTIREAQTNGSRRWNRIWLR